MYSSRGIWVYVLFKRYRGICTFCTAIVYVFYEVRIKIYSCDRSVDNIKS